MFVEINCCILMLLELDHLSTKLLVNLLHSESNYRVNWKWTSLLFVKLMMKVTSEWSKIVIKLIEFF